MPNTVVSAAGASTHYEWERKVVRTADGTIHVLIIRTGYITHYYSYNGGVTWNSQDVWTIAHHCSIDKDSNDNLVAIRGYGATSIYFKKATVTKGTPWTWAWGTEKTLTGGGSFCYYPDIVVDGNNYFHVVCETDSSIVYWWRCLDGTGDSWTRTDTSFPSSYSITGIVRDSNNNLFIISGNPSYPLWGRKVSFTPPSTWSVGDYYQISHISMSYFAPHILPDNRILVVYQTTTTGPLYFRKSTNPSDLSAWNTQVEISSVNDILDHSLMVSSSAVIRVYYCANGILYYKESTNGGVSFGSAVTVYSTGTNKCPNCSKAYGNIIDFVWRNGTADPYTVYHDVFTGVTATTRTVLGKAYVKVASGAKLIVTGSGLDSGTCWRRTICRTADGTIHAIISGNFGTLEVRHYYSRNDGETWSYSTIWSGEDAFSAIDKDSSDNLYAATGPAAIKFKKATVTKGTPWTWAWGTSVTVDSDADCRFPDILVDGNGYIHIVYYMDSLTKYSKWARSINAGVSWTVTIVGDQGKAAAAIAKDSLNNLYIVWAFADALELKVFSALKGRKITYSAGPSWSLGSIVTISQDGYYASPASIHVLPNDKIIVSYTATNSYGTIPTLLFFRKSTNASDITTWDFQATIATNSSHPVGHSVTPFESSNYILILYTAPTTGYAIFSKESTDGGITWGSAVQIYNTGVNNFPNISRGAVNKMVDFMWEWNYGEKIYFDFFYISSKIKGWAIIMGPNTQSITGNAQIANTQFKTIQGNASIIERMIRTIIGNANIRADLTLNHVLEKEISRLKYVSRQDFIKVAPNIDENIWLKKPIVLKYRCRLTEAEKTEVESCFAQPIYLYDGVDIYFTWFLTKRIIYKKERHSLRPWLAELEFILIG